MQTLARCSNATSQKLTERTCALAYTRVADVVRYNACSAPIAPPPLPLLGHEQAFIQEITRRVLKAGDRGSCAASIQVPTRTRAPAEHRELPHVIPCFQWPRGSPCAKNVAKFLFTFMN